MFKPLKDLLLSDYDFDRDFLGDDTSGLTLADEENKENTTPVPTQIWYPRDDPIPLTPEKNVIDLEENACSEMDEDLTVNIRGKYRVFHIRVNNPTEDDYTAWKKMAITHCKEFIISNVEYGGRRAQPHVHIHAQFTQQKYVSNVEKLMFAHREGPSSLANLRKGHDYYVAPAAFYTDTSKTAADNKNYCIKNGIYWEFKNTWDHPKFNHFITPAPNSNVATPMAPIKRYKQQKEESTETVPDWLEEMDFPRELDNETADLITKIPKNSRHRFVQKRLGFPPKTGVMTLYQACHRSWGQGTAYCFFPETYHSTSGLSVRKMFPSIQDRNFPKPDEQEVLWITGSAGSGKTSFANLLYPGHYSKNKGTAYWEAFDFTDHSIANPHMTVVFNELDTVQDLIAFSPNGRSFDTIKNMLDVRPFPVEIKHGAQEMIRPRRIIITSNTTLPKLMHDLSMLSRHDTSNNMFYGINVHVLHAALARRIIQIDINQLLDAYGLICIPKMKHIPFGGVFAKKNKNKILNELRDIIMNTSDISDIENIDDQITAFLYEQETTTIEYLAPMRKKTFTEIIRQKNPPSVQCIMNEIDKLFQ